MALQRGLALVTQAVQYDTSGDIRKACELYSQSVEQFEQALLCTIVTLIMALLLLTERCVVLFFFIIKRRLTLKCV